MRQSFWRDKVVVITGGSGFVGSHLVQQLEKLQPREIRIPHSAEHDLRQAKHCALITKGADLVIHLAATVGGIGYNQEYPGTLFYDNILMGVHMLEESRKNQVKKFVGVGTICAYPKFTPVPFKESNLWNGYPEETNAPYGLAKKMLLVQSQAYRAQYGFNAIHLLPVNMYGEGDNFDPGSSHVIPALIKKFSEAVERGEKTVTVWGSGKATREFLYVGDCARAIILASERYDKSEPVNIGSSFEISIKKLAHLIAQIMGFTGKIIFDTTKPDGQPRRKLDTSRALKEFGFQAKVDFKQGLTKTIRWYQHTLPR